MKRRKVWPKRIVAVCLANMQRSPTCEEYLRKKIEARGYKVYGYFNSKDWEVHVTSAGVYPHEDEGTQFEKRMGDRADIVIAMYHDIEEILRTQYSQQKKKIINLEIKDRYERNSPNLIRQLDKKLLPYVQRWYPQRKS